MWFVLWSVGCGGGAGAPCAADEECRGDRVCEAPVEEPETCDAVEPDGCAESAECAGDFMCHTRFEACGVDGYLRFCAVGCPITPCETGFACAQGTCVPLPCDAGFFCDDDQVCDPRSADALGAGRLWRHGCVPASCETDADCPDACVNGECATGLGTCADP